MKILKEHLYDLCVELACCNYKLIYCLQHYDELMQQLNDELDNCNYFGENYDNSRC